MKSKIRKLAHRLVSANTIKRAKKIITVSNYTKNEIIRRFKVNPDKITTTYLGVDERFQPEKNNGIINKTREKYGILKPFIFFVGAWRNHKNFEGLISAFEILKNKYQIPHDLVLGGQEDPHYPNIRKRIAKSAFAKQILTPGFIANEDLPAIYSAAEIFALPSFIEGFGIIAIEAQICGCPVVASSTSSLPEVLNDSALFFNPHNHQEMAEQIYKVIANNNLKQQLIAKGFNNVKRFSWKKCAEQTLKIYEDVVAGKN